jgi:protein-disulfide isomerase
VWLWVFGALVVGGLAGWLLGRQSGFSAAAAVPPADSGADRAEIVRANPTTVAEELSAEAYAVVAGPTPATIQLESPRALGNPDAPVTIVEFSDFQCPFCRRHAQETLPLLIQNHIDAGRVYYVFKDFPIASLHPLAYRLHEAARCLTEGEDPALYWRAHDLFFDEAELFQVDTLEAMDDAILTGFSSAGLPDISRCLEAGTYADAVQAELNEGLSLGINGTPGFFINGMPINGAQPYELFDYAIGLAEAGELQAAYQQQGQDQAQAQAQATAQAALPREVPVGDAPAKGSVDAPVTIVEYSDYQCPFCLRHFEQTMPQLQTYIDSGQVRYVFKDFPIANIHPQAQKAHESARCARELGGDDMYWTMHDLLFMNQAEWGQAPVPSHIAVLKALAQEAGLPQAEFDDCLDSDRYLEAVLSEVDEGTQLGVRGTPAFFINGRPLVGAQPFTVFQQAIEQLLAEQ